MGLGLITIQLKMNCEFSKVSKGHVAQVALSLVEVTYLHSTLHSTLDPRVNKKVYVARLGGLHL